jgi:hypothetical protein
MKQRLLATLAVTITWIILDIIIHGNLLMGLYMQTMHLWRPESEMMPVFMNIITIVSSLLFVLIYCQLVKEKNASNGIKLGVIVGLLIGTLSGLGSYAYMPIPSILAAAWALSHLIKFTIAGFIVGKLVKKAL